METYFNPLYTLTTEAQPVNPASLPKAVIPAPAQRRSEAGSRKRNYEYHQGGLKDEAKILKFLDEAGYDVMRSEQSEDILLDIDLYLDGKPTSIKAQHSGVRYRNTYFELCTQHYSSHSWQPRWAAEMSNVFPDRLEFDSSWNPSWFYTGQADQYLILQGNVLKLYLKMDIQAYIRKHGFQRVLGLSWKVLQGQAGKNTICGYIDTAQLKPVMTWELPE